MANPWQALSLRRQLNILLVTERYWPSIGGVQTVTRLLGAALSRAGNDVTIVTNEPAGAVAANADCRVVRRPGVLCLFRLYAAADFVIVQGLALRLGWPLLAGHRRALMVHHMIPGPSENPITARLRVKLTSRVRHATVSHATAQGLPWPIDAVLPNPYDAAVFQRDANLCRTREVIFVGRLIPEKGADVLIDVLGILQRSRRRVSATIVGTGPERQRLGSLAEARGVAEQVRFAGEVAGDALARLLNEHRILVVPSVYEEAFGLVALEGAASGCAVIASDIGGLPEAVGNCGLLFPPGNAAALANSLLQVLDSDDLVETFRRACASHLKIHTPAIVAERYLGCLRACFNNVFLSAIPSAGRRRNPQAVTPSPRSAGLRPASDGGVSPPVP